MNDCPKFSIEWMKNEWLSEILDRMNEKWIIRLRKTIFFAVFSALVWHDYFGGLGMARKSDQDSPIPFIDEDDEENKIIDLTSSLEKISAGFESSPEK